MTEIPYRVEILSQSRELGGGFVAYFPTIGMLTINGTGDTQIDAVAQLIECAKMVFGIWEEDCVEFPEPTHEDAACEFVEDLAANNNYAFAA